MSPDACALARENAEALKVADRVTVLQGDLFSPLVPDTPRFQVVVSNPPYIDTAEIPTLSPEGEPIADDSFIVLFNAWRDPVTFVLPPTRFGRRWAHELCTGEPELPPNGSTLPARAHVPLRGRALRVLRRVG